MSRTAGLLLAVPFLAVPLLAVPLLLVGCSDDGGAPLDARPAADAAAETSPPRDGGDAGGDQATDDTGPPPHDGPGSDSVTGPCKQGARACVSTQREKTCTASMWVEQDCPKHSYCVVDRCKPACLDECDLDATRTVGGTTQTCKLYSEAKKAFISPGSGTRDRARLHGAWMHKHLMANGYVASTFFSDTSYTKKSAYYGTVDSGEWTGTYLTAESLRLKTTRDPDAEHNVQALVERLHDLFAITKEPGHMARFWAPKGVNALWDKINQPGDKAFHQGSYGGKSVFWHGWTSRDMYHGVMLGYTMAYDALSSAKHKKMIRDDVVTLARELLKKRKAVPVSVRFNVLGSWQTLPLKFDMQYVVLTPSEMKNGAVSIQIGTDASPGDYNSSEMIGLREFFPDFTAVLKQTPVIGPLIPPVPRPSSVMVLANILRLAIHVAKDDPALAADAKAFEAHYNANFKQWLGLMKGYTYYNQAACWKQYFGITIAYHPICGLIKLETDPTRRAALQQDVLAKRMWSLVKSHKNLYFTYLTAGLGPKGLVPAATLTDAAKQLQQFVAPPKACIKVNTSKYTPDPKCPQNATTVVEVADRDRRDFIWQHNPFRITPTTVEPRFVHQGVDYLVAYWLGRHYGGLPDDAAGTCLRWTP